MANIIIVLVLAALVFVAVKRIYTTVKFGGSCCGSGNGMDKKVRVKDHDRSNYPYKYSLKIEGMVCSGCARRVENIFNSDGELWAKVDLEHKAANVLAKRAVSREEFVNMFNGSSYTLVDYR